MSLLHLVGTHVHTLQSPFSGRLWRFFVPLAEAIWSIVIIYMLFQVECALTDRTFVVERKANNCEDPYIRMLYVTTFAVTCFAGTDRKGA